MEVCCSGGSLWDGGWRGGWNASEEGCRRAEFASRMQVSTGHAGAGLLGEYIFATLAKKIFYWASRLSQSTRTR